MAARGRSENRHAGCVLVGAAGVLIEGPAGAGKTTLAVTLLDRARARGRFAALVSDDRTVLAAAHGRVLARPPCALAGLLELRGHGIVRLAHAPAAVVRLAVRLVAEDAMERIPPADATATLLGARLPAVDVPARSGRAAAIVEARLGVLFADGEHGPVSVGRERL